MIIRRITLKYFRNHESLCYCPQDGANVICGPNGRGKTNLLEAVFLLTGAKSWRAAGRRELIEWGYDCAVITASVESRGREFELAIEIPAEAKARATVNGVPTGRENPLAGVLRAVLFSPEDLQLIKGSPALRRALMDESLCQLWPRYAPLLARYSKLVLGKGRLLRQGDENPAALEILPEINAQMAAAGAKIIRLRADFCSALAQKAGRVHAEISGGTEKLELEYKTVSSVTDTSAPERELEARLLEHLSARASAERAAGVCLSGVHRDDMDLRINGRSARAFASQGQARSAALALRFAQRELYFADLGELPLLLLDDILSELDDERREYVCRSTLGGQSIITCCSPEKGFGGAHVYMI